MISMVLMMAIIYEGNFNDGRCTLIGIGTEKIKFFIKGMLKPFVQFH